MKNLLMALALAGAAIGVVPASAMQAANCLTVSASGPSTILSTSAAATGQATSQRPDLPLISATPSAGASLTYNVEFSINPSNSASWGADGPNSQFTGIVAPQRIQTAVYLGTSVRVNITTYSSGSLELCVANP